jgi:dienelactone hydrolase
VGSRTYLRQAVITRLLVLSFVVSGQAVAQTEPEQVGQVLGEMIVPPEVPVFRLKQYLLGRVAPPPSATSKEQWTAEENRLRRHLLDDVVFHGWPAEWVNAAAKFEDLGVIETGAGYRIRKLRYEIVPGFDSVALLYEPEKLEGKMPGIVNVNGHVGPIGKAVEYKQKRCINFAKHGILALNLEWFAFGELSNWENAHWFGAHLDLVGANAEGLFYLEMRKGLDYLSNHPNVDRARLGVTGLSGGGWQTIILSALDERVAVSVPVAGFSSMTTKVAARAYGDLGDYEQNGTDLQDGQDYTHFTAMRAPRATLLINNAEDDCCFRSPLVKPLIFDGIRPFFALFGREDDFAYHENRDPGTHNYQLDNRLAAYRFFSEHFGLPPITREIPVGAELKSYDQLVVGLPQDNLTILGLARKFAGEIHREPVPSGDAAIAAWAGPERKKLAEVGRYKPVKLARVWTVANSKNKGLETFSYVFEMNNGLDANGVWLKGIESPQKAPATIVLDDRGKKAAAAIVSDRVNRDEQVLALDLFFTGDAWKSTEPYLFAQLLDSLGDRTIGLEAAQLISIADWLRERSGSVKLRLETTGIRSQLTALVAAALEPELFSEVVDREGMKSLQYVLDAPVTFQEAPDLFCLDLYKDFDLDSLVLMARPTRVSILSLAKRPESRAEESQ